MARRRHRVRRWLLLSVLGLLLVPVGLVLALELRVARDRIAVIVNAQLESQFRGRVIIDRLGAVGLRGVDGVDARVLDPSGARVVRLQGLSARISLLGLAYQLVAGGARPRIDLSLVRVDFADITLRSDQDAGVSLASAFASPATAAGEPSSAASGGPRLDIESIELGKVWIHGSLAGAPPLDFELRRFQARLRQSPDQGLGFELMRSELVGRGLPAQADPSGSLSALVQLPPVGPPHVEAAFDGRALGSELSLEASLVGDYLHASLVAPRVPPSTLRALGGMPVEQDSFVSVELDGLVPELDVDAAVVSPAGQVNLTGYAMISEGRELCLALAARKVDVSQVAASAPTSALDANLSACAFEANDGDFWGAHRLQVAPGHVADQPTPAALAVGRDAWIGGALMASGWLKLTDPGVSVSGRYAALLPAQGALETTARLEGRLDDPARLAPLGVHTSGSFSASAEVSGDQQDLRATARANLNGLARGPIRASRLRLTAKASGTTRAPRVTASATAELLSGQTLAELEYSPRGQALHVNARDLDLAQLWRLLRIQAPIEQGKLSLDAKLARAEGARRAALELTGQVDLDKIGWVRLATQRLELPLDGFQPSRLAELHGRLSLTGQVELDGVSPLLTRAGVPIERTTGQVRFEIVASELGGSDRGPELALQVDTNGLRIVRPRPAGGRVETTSQAIDAQPLAIEGIDFHLSAHGYPRSRDAVATLIVRDRGGTLAELQAATQLADRPYAELLRGETWASMPLQATLEVPERRLSSLPPLVRPLALRGRLAVDAKLAGNLLAPELTAQVRTRHLRSNELSRPLDVTADLTWSKAAGKLRAGAALSKTRAEVGVVDASWHGDPRRMLGPAGARPAQAFTLDASAKLRDLPVDIVPWLSDRHIQGDLDADFKLEDWGVDPKLDASVHARRLTLGRAAAQDLKLDAHAARGDLRAALALAAGSGVLEAHVKGGIDWRDGALPSLGQHADLALDVRRFQLDTLSPLLGEYVSEIGGVLDADARVSVSGNATKLTGSARLADGVVQVPVMGQRFSDIQARVSVAEDRIELEQLQARGTTGRVSVHGRARLAGTEVREADAELAIAKREALPLTLEGAEIGDAWGKLTARYAAPPGADRSLTLDVPQLHLSVPETGGRDLQDLDPAPDLRVGVRRADGVFVQLPVQPLEAGDKSDQGSAEPARPLRIQIQLGDDVVVQRGRSAEVQLGGRLAIESGAKTQVRGRIDVRRGKLDVSGKTFDIERGVVTFEGDDPSNPSVSATARWDAPGYVVYADYVGDVKDGKIKLHAEPPLSQDEIASLLLFGAPDASGASSSEPSAGAVALGVAGETAARGLTKALDDITHLDVSARIDTTRGSARPELVFRISRRVSARVTRALGTPVAGESPDRTFLTLELRLLRSWALSALFGDRGASALDLIWRRRY